VESLGAQTCDQGQQDMASNSKFKAFLTTVTDRGYFKGCEPGSIEYIKREAKVIAKFRAKYSPADPTTKGAAAAPTSAGDSEAKAKAAEEKKAAGNTAIGAKNYEEAVGLYSEAISLCPRGPNSHIYYCNRAAAYCHQNNYQLAASDCEAALALNPSYVKAYSRLGLARFFLGQYEAAVNAYQRANDLEPGELKQPLQTPHSAC
jgi:small glutamine-rich tetratricopeptide repeat-containing protein alpha